VTDVLPKASPLVLVACNNHFPGDGPKLHVANEQYTAAVRRWCHSTPLLVPNTALSEYQIRELVLRADGILLTGGATMVDPCLYSETASGQFQLNPERDWTAIAMARAAVGNGVPLLGICRGLQELNVALGGSLRPANSDLSEIRHEAPAVGDWREKYSVSHSIKCFPEGLFWRFALESGVSTNQILVNSLHRQAIDRIGAGLRAEAIAPDGTVEAISLPGCRSDFTVGVQWHPEWNVEENPFNMAIFDAFGAACLRRASGKRLDRASHPAG
jgi:putative glutamine amidotransferase